MPLLKASIKANKQNIKNRARNNSNRRDLKATLKEIVTNMTKENLGAAEKMMSEAFSKIDKAVKKNLIKKNTGARKKALLHRSLKNAGSKVTTFEPLKKKNSVTKKAEPKAKKVETKKKKTTKKTK